MVAKLGDPPIGRTSTSRGELIVNACASSSRTRAFYRTHRADYERAQTRHVRREPARPRGAGPRARGQAPADRRRRSGERHRGGDEDSRASTTSSSDRAGGAEAWMLADRLAAAKIPVLTGAMNNIPQASPRSASVRRTPACSRRPACRSRSSATPEVATKKRSTPATCKLRSRQRGRVRHDVGRRAARRHADARRDLRRRRPRRLAAAGSRGATS